MAAGAWVKHGALGSKLSISESDATGNGYQRDDDESADDLDDGKECDDFDGDIHWGDAE